LDAEARYDTTVNPHRFTDDAFDFQRAIAMVMKSLLAEMVDGRLVLPEEAVAMLPAGVPLRVIIDSERGTACIFAKAPNVLSPQTERSSPPTRAPPAATNLVFIFNDCSP